MPNWAFVDYQVVGDNEQLDSLYHIMKELEDREVSLVENGFGKTWLGNVVAKLGGDPKKVYCRGSWSSLYRNPNGIAFYMETAWSEPYEFREFLESKFPGLKIYFLSVTDDSWQTNDRDGLYITERYVLNTEEHGEDYFSTLDDLISEVELITGAVGLKTLEDCKQALEEHSESNGDSYFFIDTFDIVD